MELHERLRKYRLLPMSIIVFLMYLTADMTNWYKIHYAELREWSNAPIIAYLSTLVAGLLKTAQIALQKTEKDDD